MTNLTKFESALIRHLGNEGLEMSDGEEMGNAFAYFDEAAGCLSITPNALAGVVTSLLNKGLAYIANEPSVNFDDRTEIWLNSRGVDAYYELSNTHSR
jgi:hypothetical protein